MTETAYFCLTNKSTKSTLIVDSMALEPSIGITMNLADIDKALVCSGPVSNYSYDSHIVSR